MRSRNSSTQATRQASRSSSSEASGAPHFRFCRTVPLNSTFFWSTMPTASLSAARSYSRTSWPPTATPPEVTS